MMKSPPVENSLHQHRKIPTLPRMRIVWRAMRSMPDAKGLLRLARISFTLAIDVMDGHHAVIEAWTESPAQRMTIFQRQPVRCEIAHDDRFVHLDASGEDGERWLRVTIMIDELGDQFGGEFNNTPRDEPNRPIRPVFAQCGLLAQAGFAGGSFDPPTLNVQAAGLAAATG